MEQKFQPKWIPEKECWRLVHPQTGDFIAEFYPETLQLAVTKHRKTDLIDLKTLMFKNFDASQVYALGNLIYE